MTTTLHRNLVSSLIVALAAHIGCVGAVFGQDQDPGPELFYYADGEQLPLETSLDHLAVLLHPEADTGTVVAAVREALGDPVWQRADEFPQNRVVLFELLDGLTAEQRSQFAELLSGRPEVETPTPVFLSAEDKLLMVLTDEFIAQFRPEVTQDQIDELNERHGAAVVERDLYEEGQFILRITPAAARDALELANLYHESELTLWAAPNFLQQVRKALKPNDAYFKEQWHLENTGQDQSTKGEDVDAVKAWDLTTGNETIVIAVVDDGVDYNHPDLKANIFKHSNEIPGDGKDNDSNGYKDDMRGWDFYGNDNDPIPSTFNTPYNNTGTNDIHGTPCAGVAAGCLDNKIGISGMCGNCKILPVKIFGGKTSSELTTAANVAKAIRYASNMADVLSCSWQTAPSTDISNAVKYGAAKGRGGKGSVILVCSHNQGNSKVAYPARLSDAIAVGASTNKAKRSSYSNYGPTLDVVAPSNGGTRAIYTTDVSIKGRGYDDLDTKGDYTKSFGGTSSATPLAAGVAGLMLSADPTLKKSKVQEVLQTTAEQIGNVTYDTNGFHKEYGYGRVNAHKAVKAVRDDRLKGVDVYVRDHGADKGDTPTSGGWYTSVDIKVDGPTDGLQKAINFGKIKHESAVGGKANDVYVQVHNRGKKAATAVTIQLYWAFTGTGLPRLPEKFWKEYPSAPSDQKHWHYIGKGTVNNLPTTAPQHWKFPSWTAPAVDASKMNPTSFCLLAVIDSTQDPVFVKQREIGVIVRNDNNITLKNITVESTKTKTSFNKSFFVGNPSYEPATMILKLDAPAVTDQDWSIELDHFGFDEPFVLQPDEQVLVTMDVRIAELDQRGEVTIIQEQVDPPEVIGGITYQFGELEEGARLPLRLLILLILLLIAIILVIYLRSR